VTADAIRTVLARELRTLAREVDAYPSDAALWQVVPGVTNSGGTLALHLAGNISHYIGAVLGRTGFVRDRPAEFALRDVPRAEVKARVQDALASVEQVLSELPPGSLEAPYPEVLAGRTLGTEQFLVHLVAHFGYHLGQIDYHRRMLPAESGTVGALSLSELPSLVGPADSAG